MDDMSLFVTVPETVVPSFNARVAVWLPVEAALRHAPSMARSKKMMITGCFMRNLLPTTRLARKGRLVPSGPRACLEKDERLFFFDGIILFMSSVDGGTMPDIRR
jgi:hypothetical protein